MNDVADSAARWLGMLGSAVLIGEEAVRSARRAQQVLGREAVGDLRKWFDTLDPPSSLDAKCAVIELCVAMIHADRKITEAERALFDQIVERAELDTESADALRARLLAPRHWKRSSLVFRIPSCGKWRCFWRGKSRSPTDGPPWRSSRPMGCWPIDWASPLGERPSFGSGCAKWALPPLRTRQPRVTDIRGLPILRERIAPDSTAGPGIPSRADILQTDAVGSAPRSRLRRHIALVSDLPNA